MDNLYDIFQMLPGPTGQLISGSNAQKCEAERIRKLYMLPSGTYAHPQYELRVIGRSAGPSGPSAPSNFSGAAGNGEADLTWSLSSGANSYKVSRGTTNGGPYSSIVTGITGAAYADTGVVNGDTYYYVINSYGSGSYGPNSSQVSVTPSSPAQAFIDSLNAYSPDVLLVADTVSTSTATTWSDSSPNGANAAPAAGATAPAKNVASVNGKNSLLFDGSNTELEGPFVNTTALSSVFIVFRNTNPSNGPTYVTTAASTGGTDATTGQPILIYNDSPVVGAGTAAYLGSPGGVANTVYNQFRLGVAITDGTNSTVWDDGATLVIHGYTGPMATAIYCIGSDSPRSGGRVLTGDIAFVMIFKSDQTANMAAISALINAYYGL